MRHLAALVLLLTAGCVKTTTYAEFLHQAHQVECDARRRCGCSVQTTASCVAALDALTAEAAGQLDEAILDGALTFDRDRAAACVDGLRGAWAHCETPSGTVRDNLKRCYLTIEADATGETPDLVAGATCNASWWCHDGYCAIAGAQQTCAAGTVRDVVCVGPTPL